VLEANACKLSKNVTIHLSKAQYILSLEVRFNMIRFQCICEAREIKKRLQLEVVDHFITCFVDIETTDILHNSLYM